MTKHFILLGAMLMAAVTPLFAQAISGAKSARTNQLMQEMPIHENGSNMKMNCMRMGKGTQDMQMGNDMSCANRTAQATDVVEATDMAKGTVIIKHRTIASIHWSAMTMIFKAELPSLLKKFKVGE